MKQPTILAFDTSTEIFAACLQGPMGTWKKTFREGLKHAEHIADTAAHLLSFLPGDRPLDQVDAVCYARGPGSFTGLRIAAAFCKGLCADGKPALVSVPTLQAMARTWLISTDLAAREYDYLMPCIDGRKQRFFVQLCTMDGQAAEPVSDADLATVQKILARCDDGRRTLVIGPHATALREFTGRQDLNIDDGGEGCAEGLVQLAAEALVKNQLDDDWQGPQYFRLSQAEE